MTLMNGFTSAAFRSLRRLPLGGAVRGEQGDADAVRVEDDGVSLTPERIPRLLVSLVTEGRQLVVDLVDFWGLHQEGQSHAIATAWRGPVRVKGPDRLLGVEGQPKATGEADFNVRLLLGPGWSLQPEPAIERERPCHIRHNE